MAFRAIHIWICFAFLLSSCGPEKPEVPEVKKAITIRLNRFDQELFTMPEGALGSRFNELKKSYPEFLPRFGQMINIGVVNDSSFIANLDHFRSDAEVRKVYAETSREFSNVSDIDSELSKAFTFYHHYFPKRKIPQFVSFVSGFNYAIAVGDSFAAVGLDMYMGPEFNYYSMLQFPKFKLPVMRREYIPSDLTRAWISTEFENTDKSSELLSAVIYQGKILYIADLLLPEVADSLKFGFNNRQLEWLKENEKRIWAFMVDQKMLFGTNYSENARYLNDAPFTPGMPKDSPGRAVVWSGLQIVRSYMKNNPAVKLEELLLEKDSRKILNRSGYKPMK